MLHSASEFLLGTCKFHSPRKCPGCFSVQIISPCYWRRKLLHRPSLQGANTEITKPQAEPLPLQELRKPPEEKPVDTLFSSASDDVLILDKEALISSKAAERCGFHLPLLLHHLDRARRERGRTPRGQALRRHQPLDAQEWSVRGDRAREISKV